MPIYCKLDAIISVVDAFRMVSEFGCGDELVKSNIEDDDIENLVIQQIEFCDVLILNKVSEVSSKELERVRTIVKNLQPKAKLIETDFSRVDISEILDTNMFDMENVLTSAGWFVEIEKDIEETDHNDEHEHHEHHHNHEDHHEHEHHECHCADHECHCHDHDEEHECHCHEHEEHEHHHDGHCHCHHCHNHEHGETEEYGIGTFVYYRRKPFDRLKFEEWATIDHGRQIIRTKGLVYFDNEQNMSYVYEQAGKQKNLTENGPWYATLPRQQIEQLLLHDEKFRKDWDEQYGDRMIKLVFIGQKLDKNKISSELDKI